MKDAKGHGSNPRGAHANGIDDKVPSMVAERVITSSPDLIHRGMSESEYQSVLKTGEVHSSGAGNVGEGEHGLTFYSADPRVAASYAQLNSSVDKRPAYVVSIKRPAAASINRGESFEIGVPGSVKVADIQAAYRGQRSAGKWQWDKIR